MSFCILFAISSFLGMGNCALVMDYMIPDTSNITRPRITRYSLFDDKWFDRKLLSPFRLLDKTFDRIYMSANGEVTFGTEPDNIKIRSSNCTPGEIPKIMVFAADANNEVDRRTARLFFAVNQNNRTLHRLVGHEISKAFPRHRGIIIELAHVIIWKDMPFYGATEQCDGIKKRNTFQLILASSSNYSFALMSFNKTEWSSGRNNMTQGDCEGKNGVGAKVGVDIGDGDNWFFAPHSCTNGIMNIVNSTNYVRGPKGSWIFQLSPSLRTGSCQEFKNFKGHRLSLNPRRVNWMGGVPLELEGPCIHDNFTRVSCLYEGTEERELEGRVLQREDSDLRSVVCPMPMFNRIGKVTVHLKIEYGPGQNETYKGNLYVMDDEELSADNTFNLEIIVKGMNNGNIQNAKEDAETSKESEEIVTHIEEEKPELVVNITWNEEVFKKEKQIMDRVLPPGGPKDKTENDFSDMWNFNPGQNPSVPSSIDDLELVLESFDGETWSELGAITDKIPNTGFFTGTIKRPQLDEYANELRRRDEFIRKFREDFQKSQDLQPPSAWSPKPVKQLGGYLRRKASKGVQTFARATANLASSIFGVAPFLPYVGDFGRIACSAWSMYDKFATPRATDAEPCPPTEALARSDSKFSQWNGWYKGLVNPEYGSRTYRQSVSSPSGASSNCVYDSWGNKINGNRAGMEYHRYSPTDHKWKHILNDVLPYMACCRLAGGGMKKKISLLSLLKPLKNNHNSCQKYRERRPGDDGSRYPRPRVARAVGDPHITTFDGFQYTFNGVGEFVMVRMHNVERNTSFEMQARCEQYIKSDGTPTDASVFTAVAIKQNDQGPEVKVQVNYVNLKFSLELNGESLDDLEDENEKIAKATIALKGVSLTISEKIVNVIFSSGFTFQFTSSDDAMNIIGTAEKRNHNLTRGLMGNCDGDANNDLLTPDEQLLPSTTSPRDIHYKFGLEWMVSQNDSIFSYFEGKSYDDYSNPQFTPKFIDADALEKLPESVKRACEGHGQLECLFDYETTGNQALASGTKKAVVEFEQKVEILKKEVKLCPMGTLPLTFHEEVDVSISNFVPGNGTALFQCQTDEVQKSFLCRCTINAEWDCEGRDDHIKEMTCRADVPTATPDSSTTIQPTRTSDSTTTLVKAEALEFCHQLLPPDGGTFEQENSDHSLGAKLQYSCSENYEHEWNKCMSQINRNTICYKICNVTYSCVKETITKTDLSVLDLYTWRGSGNQVRFLDCKGGRNKWEDGVIWGHFLTSGKFIIRSKKRGEIRIVGC